VTWTDGISSGIDKPFYSEMLIIPVKESEIQGDEWLMLSGMWREEA
jgi:hypothetical protein